MTRSLVPVVAATAVLFGGPVLMGGAAPFGSPTVHSLAAQQAGSGAAAGPVADDVRRYDRGVVGAGLLLRRLDGVKRVLMIAAHPDDEDTALLSALARGQGAETAYLSLTRGDGGQNLIGPELGEGLGVVRTGELVAARALDGGRQYFTRAFDFGYSKTAEESLTLWPREELVRDVTWVVRTFRPQVIVSIFSGTSADGHGQHQAAGIVARDAFEAAGDPTRFPDQLGAGVEAWQPAKFYQLARRGRAEETTTVETGDYDPLLGRSHFQLAMESRSQHRSQDMGQGQPVGPRRSSLGLERTAPGVDAEPGDGFFAGVDTALVALAERLPEGRAGIVADALSSYRAALFDARAKLSGLEPWRAAPALTEALSHLRAAREAAAALDPDDPFAILLAERAETVEEALRDAAGVVVEARVDDDLAVPGQAVGITVEFWNGGPFPLRGARPALDVPDGWTARPVQDDVANRGESFFSVGGGREARPVDAPASVAPGEVAVWQWRVELPADADPSELYYLERPRDGEMYRWPEDRALWGLPYDPAPARARVDLSVALGGSQAGSDGAGGSGRVPDGSAAARSDVVTDVVALDVAEDVRFIGVDKASGEFERPLLVVPALSLSTDPAVMVAPIGEARSRTVTVALRAFAPDTVDGTLRLELPEGWSATPASVPFTTTAEGEERSVAFEVRPPASPESGRFSIRAVAETDRGVFDEAVRLVDYPHIERMAMFEPAETRLTVAPIVVDQGLSVGYVMGSGDDGFAALQELGVDAELLGPDALRDGDLSRFDALVLGIRAYEVRPDLAAANARVLDFARQGGTVIVQYNKYEFPAGDFAPYPVDISRPHDRVTDERSPVRFLLPEAPIFTTPNEIDTTTDWEGWVTERGLYFLGEWDDRYTPFLELTDPGEEPKTGAIVAAPVGEGLWLYTGLSFFRQLPEGVPGAWRLFANLVSLDRASWDAWAEGAGR